MRRRRLALFVTGTAVVAAAVLVGSRLADPSWTTSAGNGPTATAPAEPGDGLFAAGSGIPVIDPIPWQGVTWAPLETTGFDLQPGMGLRDMARAGDLLIALGRTIDPRPVDNPDGLGDVAAVWLSRGGANWDPRPIVAGVRADSVTEVSAVAAGPRGMVAVGGVCCRIEAPAIWWSPDGLTWEMATVEGLARGAYAYDVAAGPTGFVAIGGVGERGAIWTSADGRVWHEVDPAAAGLVRGRLSSVVAVETGFLVVGQVDPGMEDADAAIWASDGLDGWRRLAIEDAALTGDDEAEFGSIVPFPAGLFAIGGTGTTEDRKGCENLLGGAHLASLNDTALSCGWMREMTWHSRDGDWWTRADPWGADGQYPPDFVGPPPGRAPVGWTHVVAGGPGLVALQEEITRDERAGNTFGIWISADGASWRRVADTPLGGNDYPIGFAVDGRRLLVLTERGSVTIGTVGP